MDALRGITTQQSVGNMFFTFLLCYFSGAFCLRTSFDPATYLAALNLKLKKLNCPKGGNLFCNTLQEKRFVKNVKLLKTFVCLKKLK